MKFNSLVQSLNSQQQKAVEQDTGILLVIAGAGSGKTRVITSRIINLMTNKQVPAYAIVALTFTNKAAQEMKERIEHFLPEQKELPFIGTFHSYCLRLLKKNGHLLESPFISILDEDDQQKIIQNIIVRNNLNKQVTAKQLAYHISHMKNHNNDAIYQEWMQKNPLFEHVYKSYEMEKRVSRALDFDDLLLETVKLFKKNPSFKTEFQSTIKHILIDEYQDTNVVQHELLKQMVNNEDNKTVCDSLCVVGDEDQSIYSWRGATVANIVNFKKDFPTTTLIKIEQNYRSAHTILEAANQVIINNTNRHPKKLWSEKKGNDRIKTLSCLSDYHEADMIAHAIKTINKYKKDLSCALLYRTHFQSRSLEEALIKQGVPYKIIGGVQFYERKEIKDILAYLRLIINPFDRTSLFRVINCPARGLGLKFEELFYEYWLKEPLMNFIQISQKIIEDSVLPKGKQESLQSFIDIFNEIGLNESPSKAVEHILKKTNFRTYIKKNHDPEDALSRLENIKELIRAINHFEQEKNIVTIAELLEEITLMQSQYDASAHESNPVLLMTLHAAKGLEFDVVVLSGLEDGLLPSTRSLTDSEAIEEERRLLYVGITRAREYLLLTHSRFRYTFGSMTDQRRSRFLKEISDSLLSLQDCSQWKEQQVVSFIKNWLNLSIQSTVPTQSQAIKPENKSVEKQEQHNSWKKNQPVQHATFGVGIIQDIEQRSDTIYLTISFKAGTKKIASTFINKI